jgi:hypothetical protein
MIKPERSVQAEQCAARIYKQLTQYSDVIRYGVIDALHDMAEREFGGRWPKRRVAKAVA